MEFIINFQNSILYELIRHFLGVFFYALLTIYLIYKGYNMYLIKKLNCKDEYKEKKKEILSKIKETYRPKAKKLLIFMVLIGISIFGFPLFFIVVSLFIDFFAYFGFGITISSLPIISTFINFLVCLLSCSPILFICFITLLFYVIIYSIFIKGIYVSINIKKFLKEKKTQK